jgi:septal ring factor EnvC (AmiA/AmiB activator)
MDRACTKLKSLLLPLAAIGLCLPPALAAQNRQARELKAVRQKIAAVERRLERQTAARDRSADALKQAELAVADATRKLAAVKARQREQQAKQKRLDERKTKAEARLQEQQRALAHQVKLSYMTGRQELFKLLLSQQDPARLGRMMVYYGYFNRARSRRIEAARGEIETLHRLSAESAAVQRKLDGLAEQNRARLDALEQTRRQRSVVLAKFNREVAASGNQVKRLKQQEQRLAGLVVQLGKALAEFPVNVDQPFAKLKGRLAWPVRGPIIGDYGKRRRGGPMRWKGVLLKAPEGTPVRAIYHGRVAFSDWLPGLGLLIIVDHGDGYMSLYAHNEALLKESGDWVNPGDEIAEVGDSGGRPAPSLYFEIRDKGKPVNPHKWMARAP